MIFDVLFNFELIEKLYMLKSHSKFLANGNRDIGNYRISDFQNLFFIQINWYYILQNLLLTKLSIINNIKEEEIFYNIIAYTKC